MEAKAKVMYARISPIKVNQVLKTIRKKDIAYALNTLEFTVKGSSGIIKNAILSAMANGGIKDNFNRYFLKEAYVGYGPTLKRARAGSFGRPSMRRKKTTHLTVIIGD